MILVVLNERAPEMCSQALIIFFISYRPIIYAIV